MAIGKSRLHKMLRRGRLLSEAVMWFDAFDTSLKEQILDWIKEDQLRSKGVDADGNVIGYYSLTTELINPAKKYNTHFTLYDKGHFFRSVFITVLREELRIDATSESFREMHKQDWFTERILGLTDENITKLKSEIKKKYVRKARQILLGS